MSNQYLNWKYRAIEAEKQVDTLEQELERAQKQCAAMRNALGVIPVLNAVQKCVEIYPLFKRFIKHTPLENDISAMAADCVATILRQLPADAGRDFVPRAELEAAEQHVSILRAQLGFVKASDNSAHAVRAKWEQDAKETP